MKGNNREIILHFIYKKQYQPLQLYIITVTSHGTNTKKALPSSAASSFSSLNCGLQRTYDWAAAAPVSIFRVLPRQILADGLLVLLQACLFPFVILFLTCVGCEAWPFSCLLWDADLERDESTSDVYNRTDIGKSIIKCNCAGWLNCGFKNAKTVLIEKYNQTPLTDWEVQCIQALLVLLQQGTLKCQARCQWRTCKLVWQSGRLVLLVLFVSCLFLEYSVRNSLKTDCQQQNHSLAQHLNCLWLEMKQCLRWLPPPASFLVSFFLISNVHLKGNSQQYSIWSCSLCIFE